MSVYVDDMYKYKMGEFKRNGRLYKMSHMIADTHDELVRMAMQIGVHPKWIQKGGTRDEHFDVTMRARADAIKLGAIPMTMLDLCKMWSERAWPAGYYNKVRK